jgi:hypothetical protein
MPRYIAVRGTSQLEGYHHHLADLFVGTNYSAYMAGALTTYFNFRWGRVSWVGLALSAYRGMPARGVISNALPHAHPLRYSAAAGVRNRGDPDWGTFDYWLLDEIQTVCSKANFTSPLPGYVSYYKLAKDKGASAGGGALPRRRAHGFEALAFFSKTKRRPINVPRSHPMRRARAARQPLGRRLRGRRRRAAAGRGGGGCNRGGRVQPQPARAQAGRSQPCGPAGGGA